MRPFSVRMWRAVAFIESGVQHSRQLDEAFENYDGDAMMAALYTLAEKRPKLAANIRRYVCPPDSFERALPLVVKPLAAIRRAAYAQRFARMGNEAPRC